MKRFLLKLLKILIVNFTFYVVLFLIITVGFGDTYKEVYQYILNRKYELLVEVESPKIIYLSGSSGAFGFNSGLFEKYVGIQTVNLSVHAGWGMDFSANMLKNNINEGDIVIVGFEPTLFWTDEINVPTVMTAVDNNISLYKYLPIRYYDDVIMYFPTYMFKKIDTWRSNDTWGGVYSSEAFDKDGDMRYYRDQIPNALSNIVERQCNIQDILPEKIEFINNINDIIKEQGGIMLFTYAPVYEGYIANSENLTEYGRYLEELLECDTISNINSSVYSEEWMFDTEYHLNTKGQYKRTLLLVEDYKNYFNIEFQTVYDKELEIDMSKNGTPYWHIMNGFSVPEEKGTWIGEREAKLGFEYITDTDVELFISGGTLSDTYDIKLYFNDHYIGNITTKNDILTCFELKKEWFRESWQEIVFITDDIKSPKQLGLGSDERTLSFFINGLEVKSVE